MNIRNGMKNTRPPLLPALMKISTDRPSAAR